MILLVCHACVARYESNPDSRSGVGGDGAFHVPEGRPIPRACPRCGSTALGIQLVPDATPP